MKLTLQKRIAAHLLGCSKKRVVFDPSRLEDIKEAITKTDMRMLIGEGAVKAKPKQGVSKARAGKRRVQKRKGLRKGEGKRKGKAGTHESKKQGWMKKIRAQRKFITMLKKNKSIKPGVYKELYSKSSGGFFRNVKHIKLYLTEHDYFLKLKPPVKQALVKQAKPTQPKQSEQAPKQVKQSKVHKKTKK